MGGQNDYDSAPMTLDRQVARYALHVLCGCTEAAAGCGKLELVDSAVVALSEACGSPAVGSVQHKAAIMRAWCRLSHLKGSCLDAFNAASAEIEGVIGVKTRRRKSIFSRKDTGEKDQRVATYVACPVVLSAKCPVGARQVAFFVRSGDMVGVRHAIALALRVESEADVLRTITSSGFQSAWSNGDSLTRVYLVRLGAKVCVNSDGASDDAEKKTLWRLLVDAASGEGGDRALVEAALCCSNLWGWSRMNDWTVRDQKVLDLMILALSKLLSSRGCGVASALEAVAALGKAANRHDSSSRHSWSNVNLEAQVDSNNSSISRMSSLEPTIASLLQESVQPFLRARAHVAIVWIWTGNCDSLAEKLMACMFKSALSVEHCVAIVEALLDRTRLTPSLSPCLLQVASEWPLRTPKLVSPSHLVQCWAQLAKSGPTARRRVLSTVLRSLECVYRPFLESGDPVVDRTHYSDRLGVARTALWCLGSMSEVAQSIEPKRVHGVHIIL